MKTIEINLYKFDELNEDAKRYAILKYQDINIQHEWFDFNYEDAKQIGLIIDSFDLDRNKITGKFIEFAKDTADLILKNHGEQCDTYKEAEIFIKQWDELFVKYSDKTNKETISSENEQFFDNEAEYIEDIFLNKILECYLNDLKSEYDYLISDECISECLINNEYDFTAFGEIYNSTN